MKRQIWWNRKQIEIDDGLKEKMIIEGKVTLSENEGGFMSYTIETSKGCLDDILIKYLRWKKRYKRGDYSFVTKPLRITIEVIEQEE